MAKKEEEKMVFATHCVWIHVNISSSILLCIVGDLAGGGYKAVAVGLSDITKYNLLQPSQFAAILSH